MNEAELRERALAFAEGRRVMTLATCGDGMPWAAPVYYVLRSGRFYFFSGPEARHILEASPAGRAAAAISCEADDWRGIRGIQMSGNIREAAAGIEAGKALLAYLRRFPMTAELLGDGVRPSLDNFRKKFRVRFYRFEPERAYYLDNSLGFGFREEVRLD